MSFDVSNYKKGPYKIGDVVIENTSQWFNCTERESLCTLNPSLSACTSKAYKAYHDAKCKVEKENEMSREENEMSRETSLIICCLEASNENKNVKDYAFERIRNNEIKNIMDRESSPHKQIKTDQDWGLIFEKSCEFNRFEFLKWIQTTMRQKFSEILSHFVEQGFTKACANNHLNVVKYLLDNFDYEIFDFNEAFVAACGKGSLDVVEFLYAHTSIDDNNDGFVLACENGHLEVVKYLLDTHKLIRPRI